MDFSDINFARLFYLVLILILLLFLFFISNKKNLNKNLQNLSIWFIIFFGAITSYYIWNDIKFNAKQNVGKLADGDIIIEKSMDGHFYLPLEINEKIIKFLVDTGATQTLIAKKDFLRLNPTIKILPKKKKLETANGFIFAKTVFIEKIKLFDIEIGASELLTVTKEFEGPKRSLLGLDLLNKFSNFEISKNFLKLSF